jgi:hypothetical protein
MRPRNSKSASRNSVRPKIHVPPASRLWLLTVLGRIQSQAAQRVHGSLIIYPNGEYTPLSFGPKELVESCSPLRSEPQASALADVSIRETAGIRWVRAT